MFKFKFNKTHFSKLSDKHVLALAIYAEEEDSKIYYYFANTFKKDFPETAKLFDEIGKEENERTVCQILYRRSEVQISRIFAEIFCWDFVRMQFSCLGHRG